MTTVAVNTRLARHLWREFDEARRRSGLGYWEPPLILAWPAWLAQLWEEAAYAGLDERALLSGEQERVLWEAVIRESAAGEELLSVDGAAQTASEAWAYLHDWVLPKHRAAFAGVPDTEAFFGWMTAFRERLARGGFITAAELPSVVRGSAEFVCGFDELTPAQKGFLRDAREYPVPARAVREIWRVGCPDEVKAAALWARDQLERNPLARVGVVLVNLAAQRTAVARVFEDVLGTPEAFHVSAPVPLSDVPLVRAALLALRGDGEAMARSPFFRHTAETGAWSDLLRRKEKASRKPLKIPGVKRPSAWSAEFSRVAVESGWPGKRTLSSEEYQALQSWKDLLAEFARLDSVLGPIEYAGGLLRLERMAGEKGFGAEEEHEPVQVMGILEAAGARFDALWIGGLHDGVWPPPAVRNPFVPAGMQRTVADQYGFALRTTERLLQAAGEIVCSWPVRSGEENLRPSPLIAGLPERSSEVTAGSVIAAVWEEFADDFGPALEADVQRGGIGVLADQSLCPFRAFARHRLKARALPEQEEGLSLGERGSVIHGALESIWSELKSQRVLAEMSGGEIAALVARCLSAALARHLKHRGEGVRRLEGMRSAELLEDWLRLEKQRPAFEVSDVEKKKMVAVGGLQVEVRMDRVDRYADGSLALLDYKTGNIEDRVADWETDRPKAPQLPLYSVAMEERVGSVLFARVASAQLKFVGLSDHGEAVKGSATAPPVEDWRRVVNNLGEAFVRGEAVVDPLPGACDRCDLQGLCRISGRLLDADVDE